MLLEAMTSRLLSGCSTNFAKEAPALSGQSVPVLSCYCQEASCPCRQGCEVVEMGTRVLSASRSSQVKCQPMQYGPLSGHWEYYPSTKSLTAGGSGGGLML